MSTTERAKLEAALLFTAANRSTFEKGALKLLINSRIWLADPKFVERFVLWQGDAAYLRWTALREAVQRVEFHEAPSSEHTLLRQAVELRFLVGLDDRQIALLREAYLTATAT